MSREFKLFLLRLNIVCLSIIQGTNFQLSRVDKYINYGVFSYSLTFEATNPADGSCVTFQARVLRDDNVKGSYYRIMTEGCRITPEIPGQFSLLCHVMIAFSGFVG